MRLMRIVSLCGVCILGLIALDGCRSEDEIAETETRAQFRADAEKKIAAMLEKIAAVQKDCDALNPKEPPVAERRQKAQNLLSDARSRLTRIRSELDSFTGATKVQSAAIKESVNADLEAAQKLLTESEDVIQRAHWLEHGIPLPPG